MPARRDRGDDDEPMQSTVLLGIVVAAGIAAASSDATTPGANGRIAYQQQVNGPFQLFTIRPDGTGARRSHT